MSAPKILVTGATGSVGSETCKALDRKNVPFRATYHKSADKLKEFKNAEVVHLDLYKDDEIRAALKGIEKVFMLSPPGDTLSMLRVLPLFKEANIKHIVKVSTMCLEAPEFIWGKEHVRVEEEIKKLGISLTSLRPTCFYTNIWFQQKSIKERNTLHQVDTGDAKLNWVSPEDIGECAAVALTEDGHENKEYNITGDQSLTAQEFGAFLGDIFGKKLDVVLLNNDQTREHMKGAPEEFIHKYIDMFNFFAKGSYGAKSDHVKKLLKREPISFKDYLEATKSSFI
eukprot:TRINITY_DN1284_c0_g1_i1.p1 TRINITY_DN1284_c0_g1~~TRINITY_DN1284_c0_g1_i1.p1  ORF type:complete len:284 (+),score=84.27 TRINITY_DN1284_c0_g1_i1:119-970(+)